MDDDILAGAISICDCFKGIGQRDPAAATVPSDPFFIARNGTIELEVLYWYITRRKPMGTDYPGRMLDQIHLNAGIFPSTSVDAWCEAYLSALGKLTGLAAGWYTPLKVIEAGLLARYAPPNVFKTPLRSLEPYYVPPKTRWTQYLSGRRVAVVSSFSKTMSKQILKADEIWKGDMTGLLPSDVKEWSFIQTGYAPGTALGNAGWPPGIDCWQKAVDYIVEKVLKSRAEVALIGCGGLGVLIGAALKEKGISTLVLGGAIQVLFGIKGGRWQKHDVISKFWNPAWVWPAPEEVPKGAAMIEGACYWMPAAAV